MFRRIRVATAALFAGIALATALVAVAAPTPASAGPGVCDRGEFCAYSGLNRTGILRLETAGNWSGSISGVRSVINRGWRWPGLDHIYLTYVHPTDGQFTLCLHYEPGPGHTYNFGTSVRIVSAVWGGECP